MIKVFPFNGPDGCTYLSPFLYGRVQTLQLTRDRLIDFFFGLPLQIMRKGVMSIDEVRFLNRKYMGLVTELNKGYFAGQELFTRANNF